ncbi:MAG: TetR/AcrR family transcriptional regulator [Oscillospiraceae bacterium]|nr:TetR/AcrR family transcriptional regulator [Oscillospiraceae bacterium]
MGRVDEKKLQKRNSLLQTAFELFTTKGVVNTSISDIADRAGVAKGTFYLYFKDKIDIKNKLIGHKTEKLFEKAVEALEKEPQKTFTDKVIFVVNNIIDQLVENQALLLFISKNLSWGIFKNLIDSGEKGTSEQGIAAAFEKIISEEGDNLESPEIMFYMICEFVSSVSYSPILYKEPVLIDDLKPHIFRTVRNIIAQYQKVPDKTE